jgi:hypothetical protein
VHIPAGAEVVTRSRDDDRPHVGGLLKGAERITELDVRVEGQWILSLGTVERDRRDPLLDLPAEVPGTKLCCADRTVHGAISVV